MNKIMSILFLKRYDFRGLLEVLFFDYRLIIAYLMRKEKVPHLPSRMLIDPDNHCNLRCPLCVTGCNEEGAIKAKLSFIKFKHIIDLNPRCRTVDLYNWGEPFLNRDIFKMIEYCNVKAIKTNIHTNLNLTRDILDKILLYPPTRLVISCDGLSDPAYSSYRVGGDITKVLSNIEYLVKGVKKGNLPIKLNWKFLSHKYNKEQLNSARKMAYQWGINFTSTDLLCFSKSEYAHWHDNWEERKLSASVPYPCPHLWLRFHVNPSGNPVLCCSSYHKVDIIPDNLFECKNTDDMLKIWNNSVFQKARRCFKRSATYGDIKKPILCELCIYYERKGGIDKEKYPVLKEGLTRARKAFLPPYK